MDTTQLGLSPYHYILPRVLIVPADTQTVSISHKYRYCVVSWLRKVVPHYTPSVTVTHSDSRMSRKNIVIFGEAGAGKSSLVNLMAGQQLAETSPDMDPCTLQWQEYSIAFDGYDYQVFDTVGLIHPNLGMDYLDVIVNAHNLIERLCCGGGIDLLVFCVRAGRVTATTQSNYRLFYEWLCEKKVPIVLVLTGLEGEERMEDWWNNNKHHFLRYDIHVSGHVCITAADNLEGSGQVLYEESRRLVRDLVNRHTHDAQGGACTEGGTYRNVMQKLSELNLGNFGFTPKKKNIEAVLTQRFRMPPDAARELTLKIRSDVSGKPLSLSSTRQTIDDE